jgi:hypothetical protein
MQMLGAVFDERTAVVEWCDDVGRDPQCTERAQKKLQAGETKTPLRRGGKLHYA